MKVQLLELSSESPWSKIDPPAGAPAERNTKKCFYLSKEVLIPGTWSDTEGNVETYSNERIDGIIRTYKEAKQTGFEPPLPSRHPPSAGENYGYVYDAHKNERGGLEVVMQVMGARELDQVLNKKASIGIAKEYPDETGKVWTDLMDHVAILPNPRLSQLNSDFKLAFAASRDVEVEVVFYSQEDNSMRKLNAQLLDRLNKVPGVKLTEDSTEEQVIEALIPKEGIVQLSREATLEQVVEQLPKVKTEVTTLKAAQPKQVVKFGREDETDSVLHERSLRVQGALDSSPFPPELRTKLRGVLLKSGESPNRVMLSRDSGTSDCGAAEIIGTFAQYWPKPPGGIMDPVPMPRTSQYSREGADSDQKLITDGIAEGKAHQDRMLAGKK